jgi:hypothetical protein
MRSAVGSPSGRHDQTNPIKVRLSHSKLCLDGRHIYVRIDVVEYSSDGRRVTDRVGWSYYCKPRVPSSGPGGGGAR